ncbi:MAG TPA: HAD-IA family hydrolase [Candidatus Binatia bacterium]|nr:HAD-IA family hydrolase [Candidatus Binatia bacterium]
MAIKAIFFDAAGTLIKPARRVGETYAVLAQKYGVEPSAAEITERFRLCFHSAPPLAFSGTPATRIEDLERAWWKELVRRVFEPWDGFQRFDDYFAELFAYFAQPDAWALYPEVAETLPVLERRGLVLSVISNFDSRLIGILQGLGAAHWFEHIFVSSRVGYAKPDRQIFHTALERHSLEAGDALHVGDSEEKDLLGANRAGLKGVLVERNGAGNSNLSPRITSLRSIPSLLDEFDQR